MDWVDVSRETRGSANLLQKTSNNMDESADGDTDSLAASWQMFNLIQLPTQFINKRIQASFMATLFRRSLTFLILYGITRAKIYMPRRLCIEILLARFIFGWNFRHLSDAVLYCWREKKKKVVTQEINVMCARSLRCWTEKRVRVFFRSFAASSVCFFFKTNSSVRDGLSTIELFHDDPHSCFGWPSSLLSSISELFFLSALRVGEKSRQRWRNGM